MSFACNNEETKSTPENENASGRQFYQTINLDDTTIADDTSITKTKVDATKTKVEVKAVAGDSTKIDMSKTTKIAPEKPQTNGSNTSITKVEKDGTIIEKPKPGTQDAKALEELKKEKNSKKFTPK